MEKNDNANNFEKRLQIQEETITRQRAYAGNTLADEIRHAADAMRLANKPVTEYAMTEYAGD